jgi:hypothetical protein
MALFHLFSLMNGDIVFVSFFEFKEITYLFSQLFLYLFIFVSVCVILNVIVAIIGDGYAGTWKVSF